MWAFVISKENPNVSFLVELPWLQSVDTKLFISNNEILIKDIKKGEIVLHISYFTTYSKCTQF